MGIVEKQIYMHTVDEMLKSDTILVSQRKTMPKGTHLVIARAPPPSCQSFLPSTSAADGTTAANYGQTLPQSPQSQLFGLRVIRNFITATIVTATNF